MKKKTLNMLAGVGLFVLTATPVFAQESPESVAPRITYRCSVSEVIRASRAIFPTAFLINGNSQHMTLTPLVSNDSYSGFGYELNRLPRHPLSKTHAVYAPALESDARGTLFVTSRNAMILGLAFELTLLEKPAQRRPAELLRDKFRSYSCTPIGDFEGLE